MQKFDSIFRAKPLAQKLLIYRYIYIVGRHEKVEFRIFVLCFVVSREYEAIVKGGEFSMHDKLRSSIDQAGLKEDFLAMADQAYGTVPKCGIACAPGCIIMSPAIE
jgi:hypothetical protein